MTTSARTTAPRLLRLPTPTREQVAYHEAGHILVGKMFFRVEAASIVAGETDLGRVRPRAFGALDPAFQRATVDASREVSQRLYVASYMALMGGVSFCLAGWAAESLHGRRLPAGLLQSDETDVSSARTLALAAHPNEHPQGLLAQVILHREYRRTRRFLRRHWTIVCGLTAALLRHGEIDEGQIEDLIPWIGSNPWQCEARAAMRSWAVSERQPGIAGQPNVVMTKLADAAGVVMVSA